MEEPCYRCGEAERTPISSYCKGCLAVIARERYAKKGAKWSRCCRCQGPLESPKQPYCKACTLAYGRERAAKRKVLQPPKPPHVPKPPPTRPAIICPECGLLFKRRHRWLPCDDCRERKKEAEREQKAEKARQREAAALARAAREPLPSLVPITCGECGIVEIGPRNKVLCRLCRREQERLYQAKREEQRFADRHPNGKFCGCGAVLPNRKRDRCDPCLQEAKRLHNQENWHKREAIKKQSHVGPVSIRRLWAEFKGRCPECRVKVTRSNGHVDHIIPLAKGGPHSQENLQILCSSCNLKKSDTIPCVQLRFPEA